jgi:anti-sigma B factor antagonist
MVVGNIVSELEVSISAGAEGPVVALSGQADLRSSSQLGELLTAQVSGNAIHLTIDASGLRFVDSTAVRLLGMAAKVLKARGGTLTIAHPPPAVARILEMTGVAELVQVRT